MKVAATCLVCIFSVLLVVGAVKAATKPMAQVSSALTKALNISEIADRGIRNE